jgi:hypothetical protein
MREERAKRTWLGAPPGVGVGLDLVEPRKLVVLAKQHGVLDHRGNLHRQHRGRTVWVGTAQLNVALIDVCRVVLPKALSPLNEYTM